MSRNASKTRALLRSKSRLPLDLLTTQIPPSASSLCPPAVSIPLDDHQGTTTSTVAKTTRVLARVTLRRCSCVPRRVWGVTCLVNVHTHFLSPLYHSTRFASTPLTLPPPAPLALANLSCNITGLLRPLCTLPEFISSLSGDDLLFQTSNFCPQRFIFSNRYYLYVPAAISRRVLCYKRLCLCGFNPSRNPSSSSTPRPYG